MDFEELMAEDKKPEGISPVNIERGKPYSIVKLLDLLVSTNGSDLHLTVGLPPIIRVHGKLTKVA